MISTSSAVRDLPRFLALSDRQVCAGLQLPIQTRKRFRERLIQPDDMPAQPLDHPGPAFLVEPLEAMRIADSACLALVEALSAKFVTEPVFDFLLLTLQFVEDPFVLRGAGTL